MEVLTGKSYSLSPHQSEQRKLTFSDPLRDSNAQTYYTPGNTGVIYDSANAYIRHDGQSNHWKRNHDGYSGNDEKTGDWAYYGLIGDRTPIRGMESFAFNMGWVLVATILPSIIAFMVRPSPSSARAAMTTDDSS